MPQAADGRRPMALDDLKSGWAGFGAVEMAFGAVIYEQEAALWRVDRGGSSTRLTEGRSPRRSPASEELAFLRGDPPQVCTRDAEGTEMMRTHCPRGVSHCSWSPDGRHLVLICPGEPIEDPRPDTVIELHRPRLDPGDTLRIVSLDTGEARHIAAAPPGVSWSTPALHPRQDRVALTEVGLRGEPERVVIVDCATGRSHRLVATDVRPCRNPHWSPDGTRLAFLYSPHDYVYPLQCQCAVVRVEDGEAAGDLTWYGEGYYLEEYEHLCWHPDGQSILAVGQRGVSRCVLRIDLVRGEVEQLTDGMGWHRMLRVSADGTAMACAFTSPTCRDEIRFFPTIGEPHRTLRRASEERLKEIRLADAELVRWRAPDGLELEGVLILPLDYHPGRRYPLLVDIHGGPAPGATARWVSPWHWMAAQGYATFSPDFRSGQTYAWAEPPTEELDHSDILSGVDHLIETGIADSERLGAYGFSYGADLLAWMLGHTDRFRAAVITSGGGDPRLLYGLYPGGNEMIAGYYGGRPWEKPDTYRHWSPLTHLRQVTTPTLLFTGDHDLVSIKMLYTWLFRAGVDVEAVHYRGEGHGIAHGGPHWLDWMARTLAWFDNHLK
jgi:dipeptidyl aminopeptidase/acylaminoacyl peptidase